MEKLRKDKSISGNAKMFLQYLGTVGQTNEKNKELAEKFGVTPVSITMWLNKLEMNGYIKTVFEKRSRTIIAIPQE
jgi:DNA-binding MarR family transcriptional regulator